MSFGRPAASGGFGAGISTARRAAGRPPPGRGPRGLHYTRRMFRPLALAAALLAATFAAACSQPLSVDTIQLGRSLNADQSIASQTTTFKPGETIYVSALNNARGEGKIAVRWYMGSQLLSERDKTVKFPGAGATEFHMQSATGFPIGDYSVEVLLNGTPVGTRKFNVVK